MGNPERFHDAQGKGYDFLADRVIELNQANPQVAARILEALTHWKRLDDKQGQLMKQALEKIQNSGELSEDVYEIVTKSLT
jgi:aminopeptidase N